MNRINRPKTRLKRPGTLRHAGPLAAAIAFLGVTVSPGHHDLTTHPKLMDYAIQLAKTDPQLAIPVPGSMAAPGMAWTRMKEGSIDEDKLYDLNGVELLRSRSHFYNPMNNTAMLGGNLFPTAREQSLTHWNALSAAFEAGRFSQGDETGAWHWLGRTSHLMEDMTAVLHVLNFEHAVPACQFEAFWQNNQPLLDNTIQGVNGALFSDSALPPEASAKLDAYSAARLQNWFNSLANNANGPVGCPDKDANDVRGYLEVLAWTTYFRSTFFGEVRFGDYGNFVWNQGRSGAATLANTTASAFDDGNVPAQPNALHAMFNGNIRWRIAWSDSFYEITDRQGSVFRYMSMTDIDDWGAASRPYPNGWSAGRQDSAKRFAGGDDDNANARITGRFWFDVRELGKDDGGEFNRLCYPHNHPDGTVMVDDLHAYIGKALFPLTVRYNAGLIGLANRRATVSVSSGTANVTLSRRDNFELGPVLLASSLAQGCYFAAKSSVTLTAPVQNSLGETFVCWSRRSGPGQEENRVFNRVISINSAADPISRHGEVLTAIYLGSPGGVSATDGTEPDRVRISWGGVEGATHYRVYRHTANNSVAALALGNWQAGISFDDLSATPGVTYYYWVKAATDAAGSTASAFSASNSGWRKLSPPTGLTAEGSKSNVVVGWNPVPGATRYRLYRNSSGLLGFVGNAGLVLLATPITGWQTETSFTDSTAEMGWNYYWVQAATDPAGSKPSGYSSRLKGYRYYIFFPPLQPLSPAAEEGEEQAPVDAAPGGTPLEWLKHFNLAADGADYDAIEASDPDGDGMTVGEEYVAGTDPSDAASLLAVDMKGSKTGEKALCWQGLPGRVYRVMRASSLNSGAWERVGDPIVCTDFEPMTVTDEATDSPQRCYYRVTAELE